MNKIEDQRGAIRYSCRLQLPCNAPFEAVEGPECNSMRGAQQVGFFHLFVLKFFGGFGQVEHSFLCKQLRVWFIFMV